MIWKMTGFDDADFFQTEQTVNRKKSGFRAAQSCHINRGPFSCHADPLINRYGMNLSLNLLLFLRLEPGYLI